MRTGLIAAVVVALVVGGSALLLAEDDDAATKGGAQRVTKVDIKDFKFEPPELEAKVGGTIRFTNLDKAKHTATSQPQGTFDSGDITQDQTKPVRFTKAGTFKYYCVYHAFMTGNVKVSK